MCWAVCPLECQWKKFSLVSQGGQQPRGFYFLPAPSSRAWTTDHSHVQILAPGNRQCAQPWIEKARKLTEQNTAMTVVDRRHFTSCQTNIYLRKIWSFNQMNDEIQPEQQNRTTNEQANITSEGFTFFRMSDITPIRVRTCCRDSPSRGTPSAKVSAPSAPGSHKCLIKSDTYAL